MIIQQSLLFDEALMMHILQPFWKCILGNATKVKAVPFQVLLSYSFQLESQVFGKQKQTCDDINLDGMQINLFMLLYGDKVIVSILKGRIDALKSL